MTATLQAGVPLREAQARFAAVDQCSRLIRRPPARRRRPTRRRSAGSSPPATAAHSPTATAAPRDLVVGMTVALADGTIARSGGTVIKNVAGYDVAKLFCGSFGTLG